MTALIASLLATAAMVGIVLSVAKRRPPGTPLTWGEAYVAALFVFAFMLLAYAIVPNQWLAYADNTLKWRSDKIGIPVGPLHYLPGWPDTGKVLNIPTANNVLWPKGITFFGRGKVVMPALVLRDIVATVIYVAFIAGQGFGWAWWQRRGKQRVEPLELTSAYGRPLVKKA